MFASPKAVTPTAMSCELSNNVASINEKIQSLPMPKNKIQAEYVWIDGTDGLRSKTRTITLDLNNNNNEKKSSMHNHSSFLFKEISLEDIPCWNYDGSSTGQAMGDDSEIWLKPVKFIKDPFRRGKNIIVLCECLDAVDMKPIKTNHRSDALKIFNNKKVFDSYPWYGIEQEYTMYNIHGNQPIGFPKNGYPAPQGPYYCGVGAGKVFCRSIVEYHYRCCLYSHLNISGINAEVMPGQWEFQIGPCLGIDASDQLWLARYLLMRCAEEYNVSISFSPKPIMGDWNGAGCHTNYSTKKMRDKNGYKEILSAIKKLEKTHEKHMKVYGIGNENRLTGKHETAHFDNFKSGVADRSASIRIPRQTFINKCGYFEDRRPAANMDPYSVTSLIAETTILGD